MQEELEKIKSQAEEYLAGWKRAKADLVNFQKQVERERAEWFMYAGAGCVKAMLPVLDSLEAAVSSPSPDLASTQSPSPLGRGGGEGLQKIRDQMLEALKSIGVEAIPVAKEPPNPELHDVVGVEEIKGDPISDTSEIGSPGIAPGLMAREVQRGYTLHGKVLRVAKVIVSE